MHIAFCLHLPRTFYLLRLRQGITTTRLICMLQISLNKAVGIARRVRVGQFQLPYDLSAA